MKQLSILCLFANFRFLAGTFLVAGSCLSLEASAGEHSSTQREINPAKIYHSYCSVCHGDRGDGQSKARAALAPSPRNFTTPESAAELTRERMIYSVTNGRPGTAMQPMKYRLKPEEIEAVVDYIRANFMQTGAAHPATPAVAKPELMPTPAPEKNESKPQRPPQAKAPSGPTDFSAPFPKGLVGNTAKGKQLYMNTCVTCHGPKGNGQGPRAYFIFPKPRNFTHVTTRTTLNRPLLFNAVSKGKVGTVMPAWDKVLTDQEIANVAEFVFQQFIRPESAKSAPRG